MPPQQSSIIIETFKKERLLPHLLEQKPFQLSVVLMDDCRKMLPRQIAATF
jgi:hypothetical protein